VDDAGLVEGLRIHGFKSLRHALQAVRNGDEDVLHASGLEPVEHARPEACALVLGDPHAQNLTRTVRANTNPEMNSHVLYGCAAADFDSKGVEESDGIHTCERAILPLLDVLKHPVSDLADVVGADVHPVEVVDEGLDVTGAHAPGVHGDDLLVHLAERAAVLGHDDRVESVLTVARNAQRQRTKLGLQGLVAKAVALVGNLGKLVSGDLFRRRFSGLTACEMGIHFSLQHGFNEALGEGTDGLGEGFGAQRAARCSKLGNVLADMVIEGVGGLLTRIAFGIRVHWMHPIGGLRLSHGHKISDALDGALRRR